jgi:hypothetical protein
VSHPVTLTLQNKKPVNINAEEYYLLNDTMEAFFRLVQNSSSSSKKTINLCSHSVFANMMNHYKTDDIFNVVAPTIDDDE